MENNLIHDSSKGKLEKLNAAQIAHIEVVKNFWLDYIFSCKNKINKESAKKGIDWLYALAGKPAPVIVYVDSPIGCQYAVALLKGFIGNKNQLNSVRDSVRASVWDSVKDSVRAFVWNSVWASVWNSVRASVRASMEDSVRASVQDSVQDSVRDSVRASVWNSVWASVKDSVRASVWDSVWASVWASVQDSVEASVWASVQDSVQDSVWASVQDSVGASVGASVGSSVGASVRDSVKSSVGASVGASVEASVRAQKMEYSSFCTYGSISDYGWVSFYDYFAQIGVINDKKYNEFKNLLLSGVYDMIQLNGFCIVSNMPNRIVRNDSGRLHNPNGPAIEFEDGYCQYYINGRALPSWIWEKAANNEITKEMFLSEKNNEIKGGIYAVMGQKRIMKMLGAVEIDQRQIVHANGDLENVTLLKTKEYFSEIDNQPFAWVKMTCPSTGTEYLQGVEPHHTNALSAIASLSMFKPEEYSLTHRS